jgi:hypothetical protein
MQPAFARRPESLPQCSRARRTEHEKPHAEQLRKIPSAPCLSLKTGKVALPATCLAAGGQYRREAPSGRDRSLSVHVNTAPPAVLQVSTQVA